MKKARKFLKKYKGAILGSILLILIVGGLIELKAFFFPNESGVIYGNRLAGREKLEIKEETKSQIKEALKEKCSSVKIRIAGRLIYVIAVVNDDVSKEDARGLGDKTLEFLSDQEKVYYDVQILLDNKGNKDQFPIIGYKHHTKNAISWTKDR